MTVRPAVSYPDTPPLDPDRPEGASSSRPELDEIYERAPFGLARFNTAGRYEKVNSFLASLHRVPVEAHIGKTAAEVVPGIGERIDRAIADVIRTGERRAISLGPDHERYLAAEIYPILGDGLTLLGVGAIVRDLTPIVRAERVLRDHAAFERLIGRISARLARIPAHEIESGIEEAVGEAARFLRIEHGALLRIGPRDLEWRGIGESRVFRTIRRTRIAWFVEAMREGRVLALSDVRVEMPDSAEGEREVAAAAGVKSLLAFPLSVGGNLSGAIVYWTTENDRQWDAEIVERLLLLSQVLANVLDRRRAEDESSRQREELFHLWRLGTVNQLTATIAHDVRAPLTAIVANAAAAARFLDLPGSSVDEVREALIEIQRDGQRAGDVVARARELLGRREPCLVPIDLPQLLEDTVELAHSTATALGAVVILRIDRPVPPVEGDAAQIQQVVLNLIANAAESMAEATPPPREVLVRCRGEGDQAVVAVEDRGEGLPEGALERLFEPFLTTKEHGLGLGLPLCKAIIERHGGKITAENARPRGAIFRFSLPRAEEDS
ncbi:MAG TPA: ATP-binding protein [Thermoanaerobaculia bacterium]|nr:ATP-binding protein [Thermoanaerobaculia bacterium]